MSQLQKFIISVVIRTYNSQETIDATLKSVFKQSFPKHLYEVLVVDDGSEDNTLKILGSYDSKVRLLKTSHIGFVSALNLGLKKAKGVYVIILDSDDLFESDLLKEMYSAIKKNPDASFVYCDYFELNERKKQRKLIRTGKNIFHTIAGGILFKKSSLKKCNYYDESLIFPEYDLLSKFSKINKGIYINKPLFTYKRRVGSITSNSKKVERGLRQLEKKYKKRLPIRSYSLTPKIIIIGCKEMGYYTLKFLLKRYKKYLVGIFLLHEDLQPVTSGFKSFDDLTNNLNVPIFKVHNINTKKSIEILKKLSPTLMIQIAWSQLIKDAILEIPLFGCVGFHASLLPKDRGGSPVNWGTTMFYLEPGLDNGDIIDQQKFAITLEDTCKTVYKKITKHNIVMLKKHLPNILIGQAPRKKQNEKLVTYNKRRKPKDGIIDWKKTSLEIYNFIRALTHPYPGAFTYKNSKKLYIWKASLYNKILKHINNYRPGQIIKTVKNKGLIVKTGDGVILVNNIQEEGKKEIPADKINFSNYEYFSICSPS